MAELIRLKKKLLDSGGNFYQVYAYRLQQYGRFDTAATMFRRAFILQPNNLALMRSAAQCYLSSHHYRKARACARTLMNPNNTPQDQSQIYVYIAHTYRCENAKKEGLEAIEQARRAWPSNANINTEAKALHRLLDTKNVENAANQHRIFATSATTENRETSSLASLSLP